MSFLGVDIDGYCKGYDKTSTPADFSLCFEGSVMSFTINIVCVVVGLLYTVISAPSQYSYRWNTPLFIITLITGLGSLIPQFMILNVAIKQDIPVLLYNAIIISIVTVFVIFVMCVERSKGNVSTLPVWTYWCLQTISLTINLRTLIFRSWQITHNLDSSLPTLTCIYWGLVVINLIVQSVRELPEELLYNKPENWGLIDSDKKIYNKLQSEDDNLLDDHDIDYTEVYTEMKDADQKMKYDREILDSRKPCPNEYASFLDYITFNWISWMIWKGYKRPLEEEDLYQVPDHAKTSNIINEFYTRWTGESPCPDGRTSFLGATGLVKAIFFSNWKSIGACVIFKLANDLLNFVPPQVLKKLIYFSHQESSGTAVLGLSYGLVWCCILLAAQVLQTFCIQAYFDNAQTTGMKVRVAMVSAIYRKALLLNNSGHKSSQVGQMINLMQVDAQKFQDIFTYVNMLWSAPLQIVLSMFLLYQELQASTFVGLSVTVLVLPFNSILMGKLQAIQRIIMSITDQRVRKTNGVLDGIKVIKLYGWEENFTNEVGKIRKAELGAMKKRVILSVITTFMWTCTPILVSLFSFLCYSLLGNNLTSQKAFVSLALFNILRFPLVMLPNMITQLIQARVSLNRIRDFLKLPELDLRAVSEGGAAEEALSIREGTFSWDPSEDPPTLHGISLSIPRGKLVAVVGSVGSGKSSLVSAVLGEMDKIKGSVQLNGTVSYVPQVSWVLNDTLKNNILFGGKWDKCWYKNVVLSCQLEPDLKILPSGDSTEIGEKGINLSGGQKQRVSLARAIYNSNDIYIFDDPLSAVDAHVGRNLFQKVIGPAGMIADKTRILVTHKLSVLPEVDKVIVMKDGKVLEQGSYGELMSRDGELNRLVSSYEPDKEEESEAESGAENDQIKSLSPTSDKSSSIRRRRKSTKDSTCSIKDNGPANKDAKLIKEETTEKGNITAGTYINYLKYMGIFFLTVFISTFFLQNGAQLANSLWLSEWANSNDHLNKGEDDRLVFYLGIYAAIGILQTCFVLGTVFSVLYASLNASSEMHKKLLDRILRLPMGFFDTTPLGRVLNRFSKDMSTIDERLPGALRSFLGVIGTVLITMVTIGIKIPVMFAVFIPIGVIYGVIQRLFIPSSRQLKRLESVSRSPVYNQFGETLLGLSSIRAYRKSGTFIKYNEGLTDDNVRSYYMYISGNRWLSTRLEVIGHTVIFITALISVLQAESMKASDAGLAIGTAMGVTQSLAWVVRMYTELEVNVVSVERIDEYSQLPMEADLVSQTPPNEKWPEQGCIEYKNVSVRYREGLDLVLKNLTFKIEAGERIGIVGRTGAGKSSITLTLFRILKLSEGAIVIDGVDVSKIGLHELRKRLSIIPQDPILFSNTLRHNLDPFQNYNDEQIWAALESSSLKKYFEKQDKKLDFMVQEGGSNLSVGQRQLVCLARALLSDNRIIVLDEATAAVDIETDSVIQEAIRKTFRGRTILTVAHRLNTILDYDRIIVLDKGEVAEFGQVTELKQKQGIFYGMLNDSGLLHTVPDS